MTRIVLCEDDQDTVVIEVCVIMWVALKLNANNIGTCGQLFSHAASLLHTLSHTSYTYDTFSLNFACTQNGYWAVFTPSISGSNLEFYPCPPGYCACTQYSDVGNTTCVYTYTNSNPDRQCACDREGTHEIHRWSNIYNFNQVMISKLFGTQLYLECAGIYVTNAIATYISV